MRGVVHRVDAGTAAADLLFAAGAASTDAYSAAAARPTADAAVERVRLGVRADVLALRPRAPLIGRLTVDDAGALEAEVAFAAHVAAHPTIVVVGRGIRTESIAAQQRFFAVAASDRAGEPRRAGDPAGATVGRVARETRASFAAVDEACFAHLERPVRPLRVSAVAPRGVPGHTVVVPAADRCE